MENEKLESEKIENEELEMAKREITKLSNELTYRKYMMDQTQVNEVFKKLTIPEYIALRNIHSTAENTEIYSGKTYLRDIADSLHLSIRKTSNMAAKLKDRGLIFWAHDGNGSEGTYITITEDGKKLYKEQETVLSSFYQSIIERFGKDKLIELLQLMRELENVISSETEKKEEQEHESGKNE